MFVKKKQLVNENLAPAGRYFACASAFCAKNHRFLKVLWQLNYLFHTLFAAVLFGIVVGGIEKQENNTTGFVYNVSVNLQRVSQVQHKQKNQSFSVCMQIRNKQTNKQKAV